MTDSAQIEAYLLENRHWIPAREICAKFGCHERALRGLGDRSGLCSAFAISGDKGLKHIKWATNSEWEHFSNRLRQHGIAELVRVQKLRRVRQAFTTSTPRQPVVFEKATGQALLIA